MTSNSAAFPLPLTLAEITPDWLSRALRTRAPGVTCRGVEVVNQINGTSTKIRLKLDMDEAGRAAGIPELVILKGGFETHSRAMAHMHDSEVRGYRDVYPFVDLPTPACYFADYDEEREQGIVIMEDLVASGVEFCSALRPHSFEAVARRLSVLAKFHAQTWTPSIAECDPRWAHIRDGQPYLREYMKQYLDKPEEWQRFVDSPRGAATSVRFHDLGRMVAAFDRLTEISNGLPKCMNHGDTHSNNLFVFPDGTPGFFDSLPGWGAAMKEVSYHVTCATDTADRRRWDRALVGHYLDALRGHGVAAPSFDEAMVQFGQFLLNGHIIFLVNESFYQPEAVNTAYTARFSAAMIEHDTLALLGG